MQNRFAEREQQTEQKKVTSGSERRDLRRQVPCALLLVLISIYGNHRFTIVIVISYFIDHATDV